MREREKRKDGRKNRTEAIGVKEERERRKEKEIKRERRKENEGLQPFKSESSKN